ncbi:hypothetical protein KGV31_002144 [Vibrio parahaemolyticus]|nr:hypothetical protein [Vibrio parahaemolyticus]EHU0344288.1 hypothetical protein [Vibrio parahaemolyticus]EHU0354322.1 hypothetical protein [Vibrio parahaemolyticus]
MTNFKEWPIWVDKTIYSHFGYEGASKADVYAAAIEDIAIECGHEPTQELKNYVRYVINTEYKG